MSELSPDPLSDLSILESTVSLDSGLDASSPLESVAPKRRRRERRRKHRRTNWMFLGMLLGVCAVYVFYVFVMPEVTSFIQQWRFPKKPLPLKMKWWDRNLLRTCEFLFIAWFFYFGASIGSFLNVVAWRIPAGRTIVFGGSKCPFCNTRLSFIDNTPIVGWLLLQGRCRTCRLPIAPRYLFIEIAVGAAFLWFALWQLIRGGANLPNWQVDTYVGLVATVFDPNWSLIGAYFAHGFLFAVVIMLATANAGQKPFPLLPTILMAGFICSYKFINPNLDFVPWHAPFKIAIELPTTVPPRLVPLIDPAISVVAGGAIGAILGAIFGRIATSGTSALIRWHWALQCLLIGAVLGWQSVTTIVGITLVIQGLMFALRRCIAFSGRGTLNPNTMFPSICLILVTAVHQSFWRQLTHWIGIAN